MIDSSSIETIKQTARIEEVVGQFVQLKRKGKNLQGLCPFHNEKSPSFTVDPVRGTFKCFGCGEGGDAIAFLTKHQHLDFVGSVRWLANHYKVPLDEREETPEDKQERDLREGLAVVQRTVASWAHAQLQSDEGKRVALPYLNQRGIPTKLAEAFGIGYVPDTGKAIVELAAENQLDTELLVQAGWLRMRDDGSPRDSASGRIIFPITDLAGKHVGFGARTLSTSKEVPKYVNSPESVLYVKSRQLYGIHQAVKSIAAKGHAYIVEGYTDTIAMHAAGIDNTVASCGTALTPEQVKLLARHATKATLLFDGDAAGRKATLRAIDLFLAAGMSVNVVILPDGQDPDTFARSMKADELASFLDANVQDFITYKFAAICPPDADQVTRANAIGQVLASLDLVQDEVMREVLTDHARTVLGISKSIITKQLAAINKGRKQSATKDGEKAAPRALLPAPNNDIIVLDQPVGEVPQPTTMELPPGVAWEAVRQDIITWAVFQHGGRIYARRDLHDKQNQLVRTWFIPVSNFSIEICQHIWDKNTPIRYCHMRNLDGITKNFDTPHKSFSSLLTFCDCVEGFGNFFFTGDTTDYKRLKGLLMSRMGNGRRIIVMGWDPKARVYAFNNGLVDCFGQVHEIDEWGAAEVNGVHIYMPSANAAYSDDTGSYASGKRMCIVQATITWYEWCQLMLKVHGPQAMVAIAFGLMAAMSDIIYSQHRALPMMLFYGPGGSGKSQVATAIQTMFGEAQRPLAISSKSNTDKAKVRKLAQVRNGFALLEEYPSNAPEAVVDWMKVLYNRVGYERGNLDSGVGTNEVPIESAIGVTSNNWPDNDMVVQRMIPLFFSDNSNKSDQDTRNYHKLEDLVREGYSSFVRDIMRHRKELEETYTDLQRAAEMEIRDAVMAKDKEVPSRMMQNISMVLATFRFFQPRLQFPFTDADLMKVLVEVTVRQNKLRDAGGEVHQWWQCFLFGIREESLLEGQDYRVEGDSLFLRMNECYLQYRSSHLKVFRRDGEDRNSLEEKLRKHPAFKEVKTVRFNKSNPTSAYRFSMTAVGKEFMESMAVERLPKYPKRGQFDGNAQPPSKEGDKSTDQSDLPF